MKNERFYTLVSIIKQISKKLKNKRKINNEHKQRDRKAVTDRKCISIAASRVKNIPCRNL